MNNLRYSKWLTLYSCCFVVACAGHNGANSAIPISHGETRATRSVPASTYTLAGQIAQINGDTLNLQNTSAGGSSCGHVNVTYTTSTVWDPSPAPTPVVNDYVQVTGLGTGSGACPTTISSVAYAAISSAAIPEETLTGRIGTTSSDGYTFELENGTTRNVVVLNSVFDGGFSPVLGEEVSVKGYGLSGSGHQEHAIAITPVSSTVRNYIKTHVYMGNGGPGGCDGFAPAAAVVQSVTYIVEQCSSFDPTTVCPQTQSPPSGSAGCHPEIYTSAMLVECGFGAETGWYNQAINGPETEFTHFSSPISSKNRFAVADSGSTCAAPPGYPSGTYAYYPYAVDSTNETYWLQNWFQGTTFIKSRHWVWTFWDNDAYRPPFDESNSHTPVEYTSVGNFRTDEGKEISAMTDSGGAYPIEANSLAGGGNYPPNNGTGNNAGIINEALVVKDLCDAATLGNLRVNLAERPWEYGTGDTQTLANAKVLINSMGRYWHDTNCSGDLEQLNAADSLPLRMVTKAMEMVLTPPGYHGGANDEGLIEFRYTVSGTNADLAIFPEDELVMVDPITPLANWAWSGQYDGGGCADNGTQGELSPDTGGTHDVTLARSCGRAGTFDGGYPAPVYIREGFCYRLGSLLGPCAAAVNMGSSPFAIQQSDFVNGTAYGHYLSPTGNELGSDSITGGAICSGSDCDGVYKTTALSGAPWTYTLNSCQGGYTTECAVVLLP